jgi:hypothetical protein
MRAVQQLHASCNSIILVLTLLPRPGRLGPIAAIGEDFFPARANKLIHHQACVPALVRR